MITIMVHTGVAKLWLLVTDKLIVVCGYNSDYGAGMVDILASSVFGRIPNMAVAVMMGNIITLLTKVMVDEFGIGYGNGYVSVLVVAMLF